MVTLGCIAQFYIQRSVILHILNVLVFPFKAILQLPGSFSGLGLYSSYGGFPHDWVHAGIKSMDMGSVWPKCGRAFDLKPFVKFVKYFFILAFKSTWLESLAMKWVALGWVLFVNL